MIMKSATPLALAAACLTAIATLPAHAQPVNSSGTASGSYWTSPGANGITPGAYPAPETYTSGSYSTAPSVGNAMGMSGPNPNGAPSTTYSGGYGSTTGTYAPQSQYSPPPPAAGTSGTEAATNGFVTYPPQPPGWSPRRNVIKSEHYTWLLQHNRAFREARERIECGSITDSQLHQNCLASFAEYSPWAGSAPTYGSSSAARGYGSTSGR